MNTPVGSIVCKHADFQSDWYQYWQQLLHGSRQWSPAPGETPHPQFSRKNFEWCAIAQALWHRGKLVPGASGLGFAVGDEPLASIFARAGVQVLATNLHPRARGARHWIKARQHASDRDQLFHPRIVARSAFDELVSFRHLDMRGRWELEERSFDFV
ncbi:MAG: hypothetical protein J2P57_04560 [Acidimicrobiaceae bacterium]|nr:hypothetical protein [Acidimicrobiaceae bacterium]